MKTPTWVDECLSWIAPDRCESCGVLDAHDGLCRPCTRDLPWNRIACPRCAQPMPVAAPCPRCLRRPPAFDSACAPFRFEDGIRWQIQRLKYDARFDAGRRLGALLATALAGRTEPLPDRLIPVPLARWRLYRRGYNQALEIARHLSRRLQVPVDATAAGFLRIPEDQIGQTAAQRRRNLRGAFGFHRRLDGLHVALVDDVMTTGATLDALARAARRAGAVRIEAWALARTP